MTDDRLIELIEERLPGELSGEELAAIRTRLPASPVVREALLRQVRLEQTLHQSVAQFRLPVELMLAKAAAMQAAGTVARLFGWGSVGGLLIGLVSVSAVVSWRNEPPRAIAVAIDEPASPSDVAPGEENRLPSHGNQTAGNRQPARLPAEARKGDDEAEVYFAGEREAAAWRKSLEPVRGEVSQRRVGERVELVLRGAQVLKSPPSWPTAGRMRLTLADHDRFRIHLSSSFDAAGPAESADRPDWPASPSCLTLEYFAEPQPLWVAWLAAQRANQPLPETLALAAHDGGKASRMQAATIDVGYRRGEIVVTHGETELLSAPLAGPPDRVVFEGSAVVRGLAFADGAVSPRQRGASAPVSDEAVRPAEFDWKCQLPPGSKWSTLAEGRAELLAEDSPADAHAACPLGGGSAHEIYLQLEDPLPGTGVYLGDDHGQVAYRLNFLPGENANQVCFAATTAAVLPRLPEGPAPLCPANPWFKLVVARGLVAAGFSCNGAHWSPVLGPAPAIGRRITTAGVYCLAGPGTRSIRLARFAVAAEPRGQEELFGRSPSRPGEPLELHKLTTRWRLFRPFATSL